jgi:hypothetical protein
MAVVFKVNLKQLTSFVQILGDFDVEFIVVFLKPCQLSAKQNVPDALVSIQKMTIQIVVYLYFIIVKKK